jgi:cytochrome c oxidase subunit I
MPPSDPPGIHLPSPSFWPILLAFGVLLMAVGVVSTSLVSVIGVVVVLAAIVGWTWENRDSSLGQEGDHD